VSPQIIIEMAVAAGMRNAERSSRRIKRHRQMAQLVNALNASGSHTSAELVDTRPQCRFGSARQVTDPPAGTRQTLHHGAR
jgi:hypothetical protein